MAKRSGPLHLSFESKTTSGKFTKICDDMMDSQAWQALSRSQRYLYLEMKRKYTQKRSNGLLVSDNKDDISMPTSEVKKLYRELRTFRTDIDALIEKGFINCLRTGEPPRICSIYGFSDRWQQYDQPNYEVPDKYRRRQQKQVFHEPSPP